MTPQAVLAAWVLGLLESLAPADKYAQYHTYPEALETAGERRERYQQIAEDVAAVSMETSAGARQQATTAAYLVAVAWLESGFAKDVDVGPCAAARVRRGFCDGGRAKTLWQLQAVEGWPERREAARTAVRMMRRSFRACSALPVTERLTAYAAGICNSRSGKVRSRERVVLAERLVATWKSH